MQWTNIPAYGWFLLAFVLLAQASWIYWDASRRGEKKWLWGLYGLLNVPSSLIVYLLVTRVLVKTRPCPSCSKKVRVDYRYCPYCGKASEDK